LKDLKGIEKEKASFGYYQMMPKSLILIIFI